MKEFDFKTELYERIGIAKQLGYSSKVINDMMNCTTILQVENVMHDARLGIGKYTGEWEES